MKRSSIIAAAAIFLGIGVVGAGLAWFKYSSIKAAMAAGGGFEPAEAVQVVPVSEITWQPMADLVGTVLSLRSVRISNELAGAIKEIKFESGAIVEHGQVLVLLDDATDRADLAAAQAAVKVAEANVTVLDARMKLAESEVVRMETAAKSNAVAAMEVDRTVSERDRIKADRARLLAEVDQAKAAVDQVQTRLDKKTIKAPFRGRTGIKTIHDGQYLVEGTPIVALEEVADRIYLDFAVPQEYLPRVVPGLRVMATGPLLGPEPVMIEVVAVDATVNNETRNMRVRGVVDNTAQRLRPGMFVQVRVPVEEPKPYVAIPATAVRRSSFSDQVFVIAPGESPDKLRAKQRFVKIGPAIGDNIIVLEGLKPGEQIAATGSFKLRDGALVMKAEPKTATGSVPVPANKQ